MTNARAFGHGNFPRSCRTGLDEQGPERSKALAAEIERSEYASLARVPVTLNLLLHVLAAGPGGEVLGRAELYARAIGMMVQAERFRGRLQGDEAPEWTLDTVRSVAFWNQLQGCRAQRWACFDLGRPLVALRQQVVRGRLPLLEDKAGQVQFAHLSYQESRKGKGCSDQSLAETMEGQTPPGPG